MSRRQAPDLLEPPRNRWLAAIILALLLLGSLVAPHVAVQGEGLRRSLIPSGAYFLDVQAIRFATTDLSTLALAFNATYLGLALHEFGLLLATFSVWSVLGDDVNRWLWWMMRIAGWLLVSSPPFITTGWALMQRSGVPAQLGIAWLLTMLGGLGLVLLAWVTRQRIDYSWFPGRPELL